MIRFEDDRSSLRRELYHEALWYAVKTRGRSEKKVAERLEAREIEAYCPVVMRESQWADRKRMVRFPLFPGYMFARFTLGEIADVLSVPGVSTIVRSQGVPAPVRPEELHAVRLLESGVAESGQEPHPADYLEPGDPVRVVRGPFKGMTGILIERRGCARVAVKLSAIQQAVSVEFDREVLRPAC